MHEKGWFARNERHPGYDKLELKRRLYGTDLPLGPDALRLMPEATRQASVHHALLASRFPLGLAPLLEKLSGLAADFTRGI